MPKSSVGSCSYSSLSLSTGNSNCNPSAKSHLQKTQKKKSGNGIGSSSTIPSDSQMSSVSSNHTGRICVRPPWRPAGKHVEMRPANKDLRNVNRSAETPAKVKLNQNKSQKKKEERSAGENKSNATADDKGDVSDCESSTNPSLKVPPARSRGFFTRSCGLSSNRKKDDLQSRIKSSIKALWR